MELWTDLQFGDTEGPGAAAVIAGSIAGGGCPARFPFGRFL